jgi:hypothetical protein
MEFDTRNLPMIRLLNCCLVTAALLVGTAGCGSEKSSPEKNPDGSKLDAKQSPKNSGFKKVGA